MKKKAVAKDKGKEDFDSAVLKIGMGEVEFCLLGVTPIIINRMATKAKRELLIPKLKGTRAELRASLKHDPRKEFVESVYRDPRPNAPTRLLALPVWFKKGTASMALDIPSSGTSKTQLGRCMHAMGERVPLYGVPYVHMGIVRMSDMARTPDVRTRCIIPEWACKVTVRYMKPIMNEKMLFKLLSAAGMFRGAAEWRPEKGSGDYGQYRIVSADDAEFKERLKMGRQVQDAVLSAPTLLPEHFYDEDARDLYAYWEEQVKARDQKGESIEELISSNGHLTENDEEEVLEIP